MEHQTEQRQKTKYLIRHYCMALYIYIILYIFGVAIDNYIRYNIIATPLVFS